MKKLSEFAPIPMSYVDLLPSLIANQIAVVTLRRIYQSPFPRWYNPNATCAYHGGTLGHLIEQCVALKHKVQSLIDAGWLTFQEDDPNVKINPLTNHGGPAVNALEECGPQRPKQLKDVVTSRRFMLEALREAGFISFDGGEGDNCLIHPGEAHNVEACPVVEDLLQGIMDQGQFEISDARKEEQHVCMQSVDKCPSNPKPLVIHFTRDGASQKPRGSQPILGKKPVPFPYKSDKAVPWKYAPQKPDGIKDESVKDDLCSTKVTNIFWPAWETPPVQRSPSKRHPLNHKGPSLRTRLLHNLAPLVAPIRAQAPIWEGIFQ